MGIRQMAVPKVRRKVGCRTVRMPLPRLPAVLTDYLIGAGGFIVIDTENYYYLFSLY